MTWSHRDPQNTSCCFGSFVESSQTEGKTGSPRPPVFGIWLWRVPYNFNKEEATGFSHGHWGSGEFTTPPPAVGVTSCMRPRGFVGCNNPQCAPTTSHKLPKSANCWQSRYFPSSDLESPGYSFVCSPSDWSRVLAQT